VFSSPSFAWFFGLGITAPMTPLTDRHRDIFGAADDRDAELSTESVDGLRLCALGFRLCVASRCDCDCDCCCGCG
jgi:hypothetical protein